MANSFNCIWMEKSGDTLAQPAQAVAALGGE